MKVNNKEYRTIWMRDLTVFMIDQNRLPFHFKIHKVEDYAALCEAIRDMTVRGAGAIGAAAGFAMALACDQAQHQHDDDFIDRARREIEETRPTARNLSYATQRVYEAGRHSVEMALKEAQNIAEENVEEGRRIGLNGSELLRDGCRILTHCNTGWLAFVDHGSALSAIYHAHRGGKKLFVYVDETRPRGQGALLTAWELLHEGVPFNIVIDSAGAYLMSQGLVNVVLTGADRVAANGDVANKIGTLEKAIIAREYGVPFYVAAPVSTFDLSCATGSSMVIEQRDVDEVLFQTGSDATGREKKIRVAAPRATAINPAFDVTPAHYITGFITNKGIIKPRTRDILHLIKGHNQTSPLTYAIRKHHGKKI